MRPPQQVTLESLTSSPEPPAWDQLPLEDNQEDWPSLKTGEQSTSTERRVREPSRAPAGVSAPQSAVQLGHQPGEHGVCSYKGRGLGPGST